MSEEVKSPPPIPLLVEQMRYTQDELDRRLLTASSMGRGTSQEVADFREIAFREALATWFPDPYIFTKGQIRDAYGRESHSIDCVMLHPGHPRTLMAESKRSLLLPEGVHAAIELKSQLTKAELHRGLEQGVSVKALRRTGHSLFLFRQSEEEKQWLIENALRVPFYMYATGAPGIEALVQQIYDYYDSEGIPAQDQFDLLVLHKRGLLFNYVAMDDPGGIHWYEYGEETFMAFVRALTYQESPVAELSAPIVSGHLRGMDHPTLLEFPRP